MQPSRRRVIDSIVVCGLHPDLLPSDSLPQRRPITSLQLVPEPTYDSQDKYLEINNRLYLKAMYDRSRPSISEIEFLTPEIAGESVVHYLVSKRIPEEWTPVFIRGEESRMRDGCYSAAAVNIRQYLDSSKLHQQALILCYRCDESCETAICDIDVLQGEKREGRRTTEDKEILNVPSEYKTVNHAFVIRNRNKYLIYRRMHNKLDSTYQPTLLEQYPSADRTNPRIALNNIPDFCFPQGIRLSEEERGFMSFSFLLTLETRQLIYCSCLVFKELLGKTTCRKLGFRKEQPYYSEKAVCIVSEYSYPDQYCELLHQLYRIGMSKNDVPFSRVVQNLVDDFLMVDENDWGNVALKYCYGCNIVLETRSKFPVVSDKSIYCLFKFLQVDKIINLFEAMLLEKKILLSSQSKTVLGLVCEALLCLIFPFRWEQTIVPILPSKLREYTQAPVPFIIGVPPNFAEIEYEKECIIVNLDNNDIVNDETLPPMPDKLVKQLQKRLLPFEVHARDQTKDYLENPENRYIFEMMIQADSDNVNFDSYEIRDAFFEFNLTLMKNYPKYWKKVKKEAIYRETTMLGIDTTARSVDELYNTQDFLADLGMSKIGSFGYKFTETSIFSSFVETRAREPLNSHLIFFEQCLELKKSKKETHFITYNRIDKFVECPQPNWKVQTGVFYSYQNLPSIVQEEQLHIDEVELQLQPNSERYRQDNMRLKQFLSEKCLSCRGFYTSGGSNVPRQLAQLNLAEDLSAILQKLFMKDEIKFIAELISKSLTGSAMANESAVLNLLTDKFIEQEKIMERMIRGWDYTEKEQRYRTHIVSVVGMSPKQLLELQQDRQSIVAEHLYGDFQTIWFQRTAIVFYSSGPPPKDMKRIFVRVDNPAMKAILNQILGRQLESFTRFLHETLVQCEILVWTCEELRRFRTWLSPL